MPIGLPFGTNLAAYSRTPHYGRYFSLVGPDSSEGNEIASGEKQQACATNCGASALGANS
jgi:hypothetical protein